MACAVCCMCCMFCICVCDMSGMVVCVVFMICVVCMLLPSKQLQESAPIFHIAFDFRCIIHFFWHEEMSRKKSKLYDGVPREQDARPLGKQFGFTQQSRQVELVSWYLHYSTQFSLLVSDAKR